MAIQAGEVLIVFDSQIQSQVLAVMRCCSSHRCSHSGPGHDKTVFYYLGQPELPKKNPKIKAAVWLVVLIGLLLTIPNTVNKNLSFTGTVNLLLLNKQGIPIIHSSLSADLNDRN